MFMMLKIMLWFNRGISMKKAVLYIAMSLNGYVKVRSD
jgi:hypothetical protein